MEEPVVQKKTRGWPSLKKQQKKNVSFTNQAPHRYSYSTTSEFTRVDLDKEPERHRYSIILNIELESPTSLLLKRIPEIFHPYIIGIQDVIGDGNCGFRAVAVCLGYREDQWLYIRRQLFEELRNAYYAYFNVFADWFYELYESLQCEQSPALERYWMIMPLTGYLIANRFGVIVYCLGERGSMTCFPLWRGPNEFQHHRFITVANVNDNHYVSMSLQGDYPMPPTTMYWNAYKNSSASAWQTLYWNAH